MRLNSLKLGKYYFECAAIFMLSMLRPSILYASEMYYGLKENELRHLEKIEEEYLRKILKTGKGCPISQLYLEMGLYPARFEIQKLRMLYLKYVLEQTEDSLVKRFLILQLNQPTRGDWGSQIRSDLNELDIKETFEELKCMTHSMFLGKIKSQIRKNALKYLLEKRKTKGKEIQNQNLKMAEYLTPLNRKMTIENKRIMFSVRNRMVNIKSNFKNRNNEVKCICGEKESMEHIWSCEQIRTKVFKGRFSQNIQWKFNTTNWNI